MSVEAAMNFRDKSRMKDVLRAAGVPVAHHALASSDAEARAFARAVGLPLVVKPPAGAGARSTWRVTTDDDLGVVVARHLESQRPAQLAEQRPINGQHLTGRFDRAARHFQDVSLANSRHIADFQCTVTAVSLESHRQRFGQSRAFA